MKAPNWWLWDFETRGGGLGVEMLGWSQDMRLPSSTADVCWWRNSHGCGLRDSLISRRDKRRYRVGSGSCHLGRSVSCGYITNSSMKLLQDPQAWSSGEGDALLVLLDIPERTVDT